MDEMERYAEGDRVLIDGTTRAVVVIDDGGEKVRLFWRVASYGNGARGIISYAQNVARDRITRRP